MVINSNLPPTSPTVSTPAAIPLPSLAAELNIRVNQVVQAQVVRLESITENERQALLTAHAPTVSTQAKTNPLLEILRSPNLRLAQLAIEGKAFSTLTNLPLLPQQTVTVRLDRQGHLQWVALPTKAATTGTVPPLDARLAQNLPSASGVLSAGVPKPEVARALPLKLLEPQLKQQSQVALAAAMRRALPNAEPLHRLLNATQPLVEHLTVAKADEAAPRPVRELIASLRLLAQHSPRVASLTKEGLNDLKLAIQSSGIGLERHLAQLAQSVSAPPPERDNKLLLIRALHALAELGFPSGVVGRAGSPAGVLDRALESMLAPLWLPRNALELKPREDAGAATRQHLQRITALTEAALSQVQLNQYRTTSAQLADNNAPTSFFTDIPLRMADGFVTVFFQFQEIREPEKKRKHTEQTRKRRSRWVVFLEMTIEDQGQLAVEVSVVDQQVDAQFWSDNTRLREGTELGLRQLRQQLEDRGLTVTDLRCSSAPIPQKNVQLDYSLIDVKT